MKFEQEIQNFSGQPLTRQILLDVLKDYKRPQDKISELVRKKELIPVKRGVFIPGPHSRLLQPEPFLLANHLYGPSYISLETALSYWRLIPEQAFEIASMTIDRSKKYKTSVGRFTYTHLPLPYYSFGIKQVKLAENQVALVASPEKAICDKLIATSGLLFRSVTQLKGWILEEMRMDPEGLRNLQTRTIHDWLSEAPKRKTLELLIKILDDL
jgi:hypothetical protein